MSRFDQEWALVPDGARWTAVLVTLAYVALMAGIFLLPPLAGHDPKALLVLSPFFLLTLVGAVPIAIYVLLVGYVFGDALRRGPGRAFRGRFYAVGSVQPLWYFGTTSALASASPVKARVAGSQ